MIDVIAHDRYGFTIAHSEKDLENVSAVRLGTRERELVVLLFDGTRRPLGELQSATLKMARRADEATIISLVGGKLGRIKKVPLQLTEVAP